MQFFCILQKSILSLRWKLLAGGGKSSLLLIAALFVFSTLYFSSCAKEDVVPDEVADVGDVLGKKGGVSTLDKNVEPSDCNCYMQVVGVQNIPADQLWILRDITDLSYWPSCIFTGFGDTYNSPTGDMLPLPTPFISLAPPDAGCHKFRFTLPGMIDLQEPITLNAIVRCYAADKDGVDVLQKEFAIDFVFQEGFTQAENPNVRLFWRFFSCSALPNEVSIDCSPYSISPGTGE